MKSNVNQHPTHNHSHKPQYAPPQIMTYSTQQLTRAIGPAYACSGNCGGSRSVEDDLLGLGMGLLDG